MTAAPYPARLEIDYPDKLDRVSTIFRLIYAIPIVILIAVLSGSGTVTFTNETAGGIASGLAIATALMIVIRRRYPRWWFDFAVEFTRFANRIGAYVGLLTDRYPSTVDEQSVHIEVDYPDVEQDLNRWLPLVKWLLAIPHIIVLVVLSIGAVLAVIAAWFAIVFTGRYPRVLFDYVVGVSRWWLRVNAYATLLVTDRYPPFSLAP